MRPIDEHFGDMFGRLTPKPIPDTPTHCRGCRAALDPLRRFGGFCAPCVRSSQPARLYARKARA